MILVTGTPAKILLQFLLLKTETILVTSTPTESTPVKRLLLLTFLLHFNPSKVPSLNLMVDIQEDTVMKPRLNSRNLLANDVLLETINVRPQTPVTEIAQCLARRAQRFFSLILDFIKEP